MIGEQSEGNKRERRIDPSDCEYNTSIEEGDNLVYLKIFLDSEEEDAIIQGKLDKEGGEDIVICDLEPAEFYIRSVTVDEEIEGKVLVPNLQKNY